MLKRIVVLFCFLQPLILFSQELRVNYQGEEIGKILKEWEQKWGYSVFYSPSRIDTTEKITYKGKGTPAYLVSQVLGAGFYDFTLNDKQLVIKGYRHRVSISGFVKEVESEEDLPYVNFYVRSLGVGTSSNAYGYFSLDVPGDSFLLEISCVGYRKRMLVFSRRGNYKNDIYLEPYAELAEAVITDTAGALFVFQEQGSFRINHDVLNQMTGVGNEKDLVRTLQMLPGVQKGTDASNGMVVRGGTVDQNLIMLDDAPIYNSAHLLGFFSVFSSDAVKSAELYKSGFSARHGGRLSSVLDVRTREGNRTRFGGHARAGTVASSISLEGPIKKNSSSFYVTARRSNLEWLTGIASQDPGSLIPHYYFYDINAKINIDLGNRRKMYLSLYHGGDYFSISESTENESLNFGTGWNNLIGTFRLNRVFSEKLFGNLSVTYSYYNFDNRQTTKSFFGGPNFGTLKSSFQSTIEDWSAKYDLDIFTKRKNQMRIGAHAIYHRFLPDHSRVELNGRFFEKNSVSRGSVEFGVYQENTLILGKKVKWELGLRISGVCSYDYFYWNPEPRSSIRYQASRKHSFSFNYDRMAQYVRLLSQSSLGVPVYMWLPSGADFAPPVCDHLSISYDWKMNDKLRLRIEPYYKRIQRQAVFSPNFSIFNFFGGIPVTALNPRALPFEMQSAGIDLMIEGKMERLSYRFSYSLGHHQFRNPEFNNGKWFDSPFDRRHDAGAWINFSFNKKWNAGLTWVYSSGNPITLPYGNYSIMTDPNITNGGGDAIQSFISSYYDLRDYRDISNFRVPSYHRLDLFVKYSFEKKRIKQEWEIGLYNVYNRMNPFLYMLGNSNDSSKPVLTQVSLFPVIPSISYQVLW